MKDNCKYEVIVASLQVASLKLHRNVIKYLMLWSWFKLTHTKALLLNVLHLFFITLKRDTLTRVISEVFSENDLDSNPVEVSRPSVPSSSGTIILKGFVSTALKQKADLE